MKRLALGLGVAAIAGAGIAWMLTAPQPLDDGRLEAIATIDGDAAAGETLFWAGGCASCHANPGADGEERLVLSGGVKLASDFGTFVAPNISPDPENGIGKWSSPNSPMRCLPACRPMAAIIIRRFPTRPIRG